MEKGGTTSLGHLLAQHPAIASHLGSDFAPEDIEFQVFVDGRSEDPRAYRRAYAQHFGQKPGDRTIVAKSVGILHLPRAAERLHRHNLRCRLIFSLRNPVDRAYSSFWYQRWRGEEEAATFEEALRLEREREERGVWEPDRMYVGKGEYVRHLRRISELFGRDRVHVVLLEDLAADPTETVHGVYDFLGLDRRPVAIDDRKNPSRDPRWPWLAQLVQGDSRLKSVVQRIVPQEARQRLFWWLRELNSKEADHPPMKPSTREKLLEHFRPFDRELEGFLGRELEAWRT